MVILLLLIDLNYCFPGRLTITEFVLLSLVMLEDSGMLDTYVGELLNKTKKRDDTSAVDELEPRGKLMIVCTKQLCCQSFSHNVYCRPDQSHI